MARARGIKLAESSMSGSDKSDARSSESSRQLATNLEQPIELSRWLVRNQIEQLWCESGARGEEVMPNMQVLRNQSFSPLAKARSLKL